MKLHDYYFINRNLNFFHFFKSPDEDNLQAVDYLHPSEADAFDNDEIKSMLRNPSQYIENHSNDFDKTRKLVLELYKRKTGHTNTKNIACALRDGEIGKSTKTIKEKQKTSTTDPYQNNSKHAAPE